MAEKKYFSTNTTPGSFVNTWSFASALAGIQQGTAISNRIANKIRVKWIDIQVACVGTTSVPVSGSQARFILYHNKEAVGAVPSATSMFTANTFYSLQNPNTTARYAIMREKICDCYPITTSAGSTAPRHFFRWRVYLNKIITFQSNAADITDILKDDYGLGYVAVNGTAGTEQMSLSNLTMLVCFTDA